MVSHRVNEGNLYSPLGADRPLTSGKPDDDPARRRGMAMRNQTSCGVALALVVTAAVALGACAGPASSGSAPSSTATSPTATTAATAPGSSAEVTGLTVAGPRCPVQSADNPCPPTPVSVHILVEDRNGHRVTTFQSGPDGRFDIRLPAGEYTFSTTDPAGPRLTPRRITLVAGVVYNVRLDLDTGIR